jgi:hypothetical protein
MTRAKQTKTGKTTAKRAKSKPKADWAGGLREALATKKQTVQSWPGAGEAWKSKNRPH